MYETTDFFIRVGKSLTNSKSKMIKIFYMLCTYKLNRNDLMRTDCTALPRARRTSDSLKDKSTTLISSISAAFIFHLTFELLPVACRTESEFRQHRLGGTSGPAISSPWPSSNAIPCPNRLEGHQHTWSCPAENIPKMVKQLGGKSSRIIRCVQQRRHPTKESFRQCR